MSSASSVFGSDDVLTYPKVALRNVEPAKAKPKSKPKSTDDAKKKEKSSKKRKVITASVPKEERKMTISPTPDEWKLKLAKEAASEKEYLKRVALCLRLIDIGAVSQARFNVANRNNFDEEISVPAAKSYSIAWK